MNFNATKITLAVWVLGIVQNKFDHFYQAIIL